MPPSSCISCLHLKCFPGWWNAKTARARCKFDLIDGQKTVSHPFGTYKRFKLITAAAWCADFDDMDAA